MRKVRRGSVWSFDNPDDYYESLEERPQRDEPPEDDEDPADDDCDYWKSNCYGRG